MTISPPRGNQGSLLPKWRALALYGLAALVVTGCYFWVERGQSPEAESLEVRVLPGQRVELGKFEITSKSAVVGDPAYTDDGEALIRVNNLANGQWDAWYTKVELEGQRSAELVATRGGSKVEGWRVLGHFSVDSGQAGIFDRARFRDQTVVPVGISWKHGPWDDKDRWYSMCCDTTTSSTAGTIPFGVVSNSGMGDGGYTVLAADSPDGVVALRLVFLEEEDDL